jgi:anti-sigma regulatory factor (Ser/Thr protein kinase)
MQVSPELKDRRLLIAVPDMHLRGILRNFFSRLMTVELAETANQAIVAVEGSAAEFDTVLIDMNMPPSGLDIVARIRREYPHLPIALLVSQDYEGYFPLLNKHDVFCVIVRTAPLDFDELQIAIENLILPTKAFGLARYLPAPLALHEKVILSLSDKQEMMEDALKLFHRFRPHDTDISQIRLAFEELINNAIYHAFRRASGAEKYTMGAFDRLERGEQIRVEYGANKHYLGCSVRDNQGTLDVTTVMKKIERQITQEGLMDESGRGLYLTRTISDKMIINIHPQVATEVILLFAHRNRPKVKPFYLNQVRTLGLPA